MTQSSNRARDLTLELWTKTRIDWGFATERIADAFRRERGLGSSERREVAETLYGMIRQSRRIDFALEGFRLHGDRRELARYLTYRLLEGEIKPADAAREIPGDWKAVAAVDERITHERNEVRRLALRRSLPDWLARRLVDQNGAEEADAMAAALNQRAPLTVRANLLKIERDALAERLRADGVETHPTRWASAGLTLDTRVNVFGLAAFKEGLFEAQDEASQLVAELVAPPRGLVVDACAGAGGKTLALGAQMGSRGTIVALDVDERKLVELRRRARRAGLSNARAITVDDGGGWPDEVEALRGHAERVLVDAPCSGIGALRRNPEARWRLTEEDLRRLPKKQLAIAQKSASLVASGGRLIYATCTLLREENEAVVEALLAGPLAGWEPVRAAEVWGNQRALQMSDATGTYLKLFPHRHDTDGFFAAVLRRR